jgi:hypothetical protein
MSNNKRVADVQSPKQREALQYSRESQTQALKRQNRVTITQYCARPNVHLFADVL